LLGACNNLPYEIKQKIFNQAVMHDALEASKILSFDISDEDKMVAYQFAILNNNPAIALELLTTCQQICLNTAQECLYFLALGGHHGELTQLLWRCTNLPAQAHSLALSIAAAEGHCDIIQEFLNNPLCSAISTQAKGAAFCQAIANGCFGVMRHFISHFESKHDHKFIEGMLGILVKCLTSHKSTQWIEHQIDTLTIDEAELMLAKSILSDISFPTLKGAFATIELRKYIAGEIDQYLNMKNSCEIEIVPTFTPLLQLQQYGNGQNDELNQLAQQTYRSLTKK
jgi:hypothetical protein